MFLILPSTKIEKMVLLQPKRAAKALDKKCLQITSPEPLVQIQNNVTEMSLVLPSTKIDQKVHFD